MTDKTIADASANEMSIKESYGHAAKAAHACAALYLCEAAEGLLEAIPLGISDTAEASLRQMQSKLAKLRQLYLKEMDYRHAKAGLPRPYK